MNGTHWMREALCRQTDPDVFFPENGGDARPGKRICQNCPVLTHDCLAWSMTHPVMGTWGGTSEAERKRRGISTFPERVPIDSICKSEAGYVRHLRRGEPPCPDCYIAMSFISAERDRRYASHRAAR